MRSWYSPFSVLFLPLGVALLLTSIAAFAQEPVQITRTGDEIGIVIGGKPFTTYYFSAQQPKPYFHPLRTAAGTVVTRGFPMVTDIPGEDHDHPHHRGMFFAHGDINGIDFWGEAQAKETAPVQVGGKTYTTPVLPNGRTVFKRLETANGGSSSGLIRAEFELEGPDGATIAEETQEYTFRGDASDRVIDCAFTIHALSKPVKMGDTKEGTFAIRVVKALEPPNGTMRNSMGATGEDTIWGKRADWVDYSGEIGPERAGIAIFDNPQNLRHPEPWHARAYGLFAVNPFGEHDFYRDPKRDGSYTIQPDGSLTLRYRVIIHHGDADQAKIAERYHEYAAQP